MIAASKLSALRRIDRCWTSPALCARQTVAALSLEAMIDPDLRECDCGRWAGRRLRDIEAEEPDGLAAWLSDVTKAPPGRESISNVLQRIAAWLDRRSGDNGHAVVVTHAPVIRGAILHAIGAPRQSFWRIDIGPLSATEMRHDGSRWRWTGHNDKVFRVAVSPVGTL